MKLDGENLQKWPSVHRVGLYTIILQQWWSS